MNEVFNALAKEAQFTNEMLRAGATQIRKCNYAQKGIYFQAFTSLSTGLERIGKLCLMLDYYIDNAGKFPTSDQMKKEIGHDINKLYEKSFAISVGKKVSFYYPCKLKGSYRTGVQEAVGPYRQLFVLQSIRFWVELLGSLQWKAMNVNNDEIPYFSEIFGRFFNLDEYFKSRRTWDKI